MHSKSVRIDTGLFYHLIGEGQSDAIALFCYLKAIKKDPFFFRPLTKRGNPQEITRVLSSESGISQDTIKKHIDILIKYNLIRYNDKFIVCSGSETTKLFSHPDQIGIKKRYRKNKNSRVFTINIYSSFTYGELKTLVKNTHAISKVIRKVNSAIKNKQRATIKKKVLDKTSCLGEHDAHNANMKYCGISNKYFSTVNGSTSVSSGYRVKKLLERAGFISSKRRYKEIAKFSSYAEFVNYREYTNFDGPLRFCNGSAYIDMASEISLIKIDRSEDKAIKAEKTESNLDLKHSKFYGYMMDQSIMDMCPDIFDFNIFNKSRFLYANRSNKENLFLTKKDVKRRFGWSEKRVKEFLSVKPDRFRKSSSNLFYGLFSLDTIVEIERSCEFKCAVSKGYNRLSSAYLKRVAKSNYRV
jgi:hypothetical protein